MRKPRIFIGSSVEQLPIARLVKQQLRHDAEATLWTEGVFRLGSSTIDDLCDATERFDFAIFIFAPDDITRIRDQEDPSVRDNVLFELGLFMGRLGKQRTFWIVPTGSPRARTPTDLLGVNTTILDLQMENQDAAAGYACEDVRRAVLHQGVRPNSDLDEISSPKILCAASTLWKRYGFEEDVAVFRNAFPHTHSVQDIKAEEFTSLVISQPWDILHLVGQIHPQTHEFCFDDESTDGTSTERMKPSGLVRLVAQAGVRLCILATCDSIALAGELMPVTNVIAATSSVTGDQICRWARAFLSLLAGSMPLTRAFDIAKHAADVPLMLFTRRDFRLAAT